VTVTELEDDGSRVRIGLAGPVPLVAEITHDSVREMQIVPGRRLYATVKATEVSVFSD
jgi:molybdate transport system ATP-binding protein